MSSRGKIRNHNAKSVAEELGSSAFPNWSELAECLKNRAAVLLSTEDRAIA